MSGKLAVFEGKNVYFKMGFSQYTDATPVYTNEFPFYFEGKIYSFALYSMDFDNPLVIISLIRFVTE